MNRRALGRSGLDISVLSFGTSTFGRKPEGWSAFGQTEQQEADRLIAICRDAGVTLFDTADMYSDGEAERILGKAIGKHRADVLIATKGSLPMSTRPDDAGSSRKHLIAACEASLKRLGTDWIDLYQLHSFDALTPLEETLRALDDLITAGKIRYIGCSNFGAWQLMKALAISSESGLERLISNQVYYSLVGRDFEHELMPLAVDQGVGTIVWGPLASGFLSGKYGGDPHAIAGSRLDTSSEARNLVDWQNGPKALDICRSIAEQRNVSIAQVALNWLLCRRTVCTIALGARTEEQLLDNLNATEWQLSREEIERLDAATDRHPPYPLWHQRSGWSLSRNPPIDPIVID